MIARRVYPRVGVVGNPSDGYYGRTISFTFDRFCATSKLEENEELVITGSGAVRKFESVKDLAGKAQDGYDRNIVGLIQASIKKFYDHCIQVGQEKWLGANFSISCSSTIPKHVGLGGSSAIIASAMKCLFDFYKVNMDKASFPGLILSVETEELGIGAGFV